MPAVLPGSAAAESPPSSLEPAAGEHPPVSRLLARYPSCTVCASLAAGIAAARLVAGPLPLLAGLSVIAAGARATVSPTLPRQAGTRRSILRVGAFFVLGCLRSPVSEPATLEGQGSSSASPAPYPVRIQGTVTRPAVVVERSLRGRLTEETRFGVTPHGAQEIDVLCRGVVRVPAGGSVSLSGTWLPPRPPRHPGDRRPHRSRLIVPHALNVETSADDSSTTLRSWLGSCRGRLLETLRTLYDDDKAGLLAALLLGDRRLLTPAVRGPFEESGTMHLLAISGLHVGLVLYALLLLPLPLLLATPLRLGMLIGFSLLSGGHPPVVRAAFMLAVHLLLRALGRCPTGLNTLGWAATALLLWDPLLLYAAGFQLSFCGVFFLLTWLRVFEPRRASDGEPLWLALPGINGVDRDRNRRLAAPRRAVRWLTRGVAGALKASLVAWVGTTPLVAYHFLSLHPLAPLATVAAAPLLPAVLLGGLLSIASADWAAPVARTIASLVSVASDGMLGALSVWTHAAWSSVDVVQPPLYGVALAYAALLLALWRRLRVGALACTLILATRLLVGTEPEAPALWIFDVGSGDAMLLRSPGTGGVLIDAGTLGDEKRAGDTLRRAILSTGTRTLEGAFLTHGHADHARGLVALRGRLPLRQLWLPAAFAQGDDGHEVLTALSRDGTRLLEIAAGDRVAFPGAPAWKVEVLHPHRGERLPLRRSTNDMSLALRLSYRGSTLLLLGDLEERGLSRLFASHADLTADGLVIPHHGRSNGLLSELLERVRPRFAAISGSGSGGARETLTHLRRIGIPTLATWEGGCIRVRWNGRGWHAGHLRQGRQR